MEKFLYTKLFRNEVINFMKTIAINIGLGLIEYIYWMCCQILISIIMTINDI